MRKPSFIQYFIAEYGFWFVTIGLGVLGAAYSVFLFGLILGGMAILAILLITVCAFGLGFLIGFFLWGYIIFRICAKINGAPFVVGDNVRILSGPNRDRVTPIYDVWSERGQVRVELGEETKKNFSDVFAYFEVCRDNHS